jgi:hypothetical protein
VHLQLWHVVLRRLRQDTTNFGTLARCCLAKSVPYMQFMALKVYNASFAKSEVVQAHDLVRLLRFAPDDNDSDLTSGKSETLWHDDNIKPVEVDDATACLSIGVRLGLPLAEEQNSLIFKSAPLFDLPTGLLSRNDKFVFGSVFSEQDETGVVIPSAAMLAQQLFNVTHAQSQRGDAILLNF